MLGMTVQDTKSKDEFPSAPKAPDSNTILIFCLIFAVGFTILIWVLNPLLDRFLLLPDQGPEWYYWKLPERIILSQIIVWLFYFAHQISLWLAIHWAKVNLKDRSQINKEKLTKYNNMALLINVAFIFLHLVQTHIWFDGLAQDVPIWSSQYSVIIMLSVILVIENPRRGIFVGRKVGRPFSPQVSGFFRRNHPYLFSWAIVYTFWFHPMDGDIQLIFGFLYMFLLFSQTNWLGCI